MDRDLRGDLFAGRRRAWNHRLAICVPSTRSRERASVTFEDRAPVTSVPASDLDLDVLRHEIGVLRDA
jgi:hypothetical protein